MRVSGFFEVTLELQVSEGKVFCGEVDVSDWVPFSKAQERAGEDPLNDGDEIEFDTEVEATGVYKRGSSDYFSNSHGNWLPGDPEECELASVCLGGHEIVADITSHVADLLEEKLIQVGQAE